MMKAFLAKSSEIVYMFHLLALTSFLIMENPRMSYSAEEKTQIVLSILTRKSNIQSIAKQKGIAPTLISLWKKQALDAMEARFQPQPKGRRKVMVELQPVVSKEVRVSRNEARSAKIKAAHLENSLRDTREKLARAEAQLQEFAQAMGFKLVKARKPRKPRKARQA